MHNHDFNESDWPFNEPINLGVVTTKQVMRENHPINVILYDEEGDWQFLCGTTENSDDGMIVCLGCLYSKARYIGKFSALEPGWEASRETSASSWKVAEIVWDDEE